MKKISAKFLAGFFVLILASCAPQEDEQTRIRIVDLEGKARPVSTRLPEGNAQALAAQGMQQQAPVNARPLTAAEAKAQQSLPQNNPDYSQTISQTFQPPKNAALPPVKEADPSLFGAGPLQEETQTVEYDLNSPEEKVAKTPVKKTPKAKNSAAKKSPAKKAAVAAKGKFYVQVGSFGSISNANQTLASMEKFHAGKVETIEGQKTIYRVLLGPFPNRTQANAMVKKITSSGHEAILVRNK